MNKVHIFFLILIPFLASGSRYIRDGMIAKPGQFPSVVLIHIDEDSVYLSLCGGTLISAQFVLTAAHCLLKSNASSNELRTNATVYIGITDKKDITSESAIHSEELIPHESYDKVKHDNGDTTMPAYDIGIIKLQSKAYLSSNVQYSPIANKYPQDGAFVTIVGWGFTEENKLPTILRYTHLTFVEWCRFLDDPMICTSSSTTAPCSGDSGSPIFFKDSSKIVGVQTNAYRNRETGQCTALAEDPELEEYYLASSAATHLDWIKTNSKGVKEEMK